MHSGNIESSAKNPYFRVAVSLVVLVLVLVVVVLVLTVGQRRKPVRPSGNEIQSFVVVVVWSCCQSLRI